MDCPVHIDTISMGLSIVHFKGSRVEFSKFFYVFLSPKIVLILADSVDPECCISSGSSLFAKVPV